MDGRVGTGGCVDNDSREGALCAISSSLCLNSGSLHLGSAECGGEGGRGGTGGLKGGGGVPKWCAAGARGAGL